MVTPKPVIDMHAHMALDRVETLVRDHPQRRRALAGQAEETVPESTAHNRELFANRYARDLVDVDQRIARMDAMGVDIQAVSMSPTQYYY